MATSFGYRGLQAQPSHLWKGGVLVSARIQVLLVVLGMIVFAALNASTPWGP
jgi:hypothetical protein